YRRAAPRGYAAHSRTSRLRLAAPAVPGCTGSSPPLAWRRAAACSSASIGSGRAGRGRFSGPEAAPRLAPSLPSRLTVRRRRGGVESLDGMVGFYGPPDAPPRAPPAPQPVKWGTGDTRVRRVSPVTEEG